MQKDARLDSIPTRGRTLDHAAWVYDLFEPMLLLGKQTEYYQKIISIMDMSPDMRVLDVGCGTGVLTSAIGEWLDAEKGGVVIGIDAAAKMIHVARKKRLADQCRFDVALAEALPYDDESFDVVVSNLFYHHLPLDLKQKSLSEAFRVLKPRGKLVVADMHIPTTKWGWLMSHTARWLFLQPQIGENIRGVLPHLIERTGFNNPILVRSYFGYVSIFSTRKPRELTYDPY